MHLPYKPRNLTEELPSVWETLDRIRLSLDLDHHALAEMLALTDKEYCRALSSRKDLKVTSGMALADRLGVSFDSIVANTIDYKTLIEHHAGNLSFLPERYAEASYSKRRTVVNILNYIEERLGWNRRALMLKKFQLNESIFKDPDAPINMRLSVDICNSIYAMNRDSSFLFEMGLNSAKTNKNSELGKLLSSARVVEEAYEMMFGGLIAKFLESNFSWWINHLTQDHCQIEGRPNLALLDHLEPYYVRSRSVCLIRQGTAAAIPQYLGLPAASVTESACIAQGDHSCRFNIHFNRQGFRLAQNH